jgi:hypothetical protein
LLFVFKSGREKSFPTSDLIKWIAKNDAIGGNNAKIKRVQPQPSLFWGETVGGKYQTWIFGLMFFDILLPLKINLTKSLNSF